MYKNNIKIFRKEKGMTLKEMAEKVGITAGYLCHLEKGSRSNPSIDVMKKIAEELGKTVSEIFFTE